MKIGTRAACAASMIALASAASAADACWTPKELAAARIRDVQTIMMVGALQCSGQGYNTAFGYDRFVTRHRAGLVEANDTLKRHFMRQAASSTGQRDYDAFATALANGHSQEAQDMRNYCSRVDSLVRTASGLHPDELADFAADVSERPHGVGADCGRPQIAAADTLPAPRGREDDYYDRPRQVEVATRYPAPVQDEEPYEVASLPERDMQRLPFPQEQVAERAPFPERDVVAERAPVREREMVAEISAEDAAAVREATAALERATQALQVAVAAQQSRARPASQAVSRPSNPPSSAGPRRAPVAPIVLAPEPVVPPPERLQFAG